MVHAFSVELATDYGVNCAILLGHFWYWTKKNKESGKHFHDGRYWTYNTQEAYVKLYPYMGRKQIRIALQRLVEEGLIIEGNFNQKAFDHTKWYALTEKGLSLLRSVPPPIGQNGQSNGQNDQSNGPYDQSTGQNGQSNGQNDHAIPVNRTNYSNPFIEPVNGEEKDARGESTAEWRSFVREYQQNIGLLPTSTVEREDLEMFFDEFGADVLREIIHTTARKHLDNPHVYFATICRNWLGLGIKTVEQAKAAFMDYERRKGRQNAINRGTADNGGYKPLPGEIVV